MIILVCIVANLDIHELSFDIRLPDDKRLLIKDTLLHGIGELSSYLEPREATYFCKRFLSGLTEISVQFIMLLANDLEQFSKHGKRTTISLDDVKLFARRNSFLLSQLSMEIVVIKRRNQFPKRC